MALIPELWNHFPVDGKPADPPTGAGLQRAFRLTALPQWQLHIIHAYPALYLSDEDMGVTDYCHLAWGFQCDESWEPLLRDMSEVGSMALQALLGSEAVSRIAIVRVEERDHRLRIGYSATWPEPARGLWAAYVRALERLPLVGSKN